MKRCLNCRQTYDDDQAECPYCGYKPRSKSASTKRYGKAADRFRTAELDPAISAAKRKKTTSVRSISAASSHSGAFYLKSGERLNDRYSIVSVRGFGDFGVAYECFDNVLRKHVVVKEYLPSHFATRSSNGRDAEPLSESDTDRFNTDKEAFIEENIKLSENNVECVPKLIECFRQNNTSYVVTELIDAETLTSVMNRLGKLSYETTANIITSVLQGLRRMNKLDVIHGDICPDNILVVSDSKTYLLDYNLSDFNRNVYTQRESGKARPGYSALEQYYKNLEIGPWTDVYAAAAVMYKMLTGITLQSAVKRESSDTLQPLSKLGVPISADADAGMMKALTIDYKKRTQSPEIFLNCFVGDGFDNIKATKGKKKPSVPSRASSKKAPAHSSSDDGGGFLKGLIIFLTLAIAAVVIYFFIAGIFPMPQAVSDLLGLDDLPSDSTAVSSKNESSEVSEPINDNNFDDDFYTSSESSSGGFFDGLISGVVSGIGDKVSSFIDEHITTSSEAVSSEQEWQSEPESSYYDDGGYYDDNTGWYDDDGNYYDDEGSYDDNGGYDDSVSSEGGFDDYFSIPVDEASELLNSFIDDIFNN